MMHSPKWLCDRVVAQTLQDKVPPIMSETRKSLKPNKLKREALRLLGQIVRLPSYLWSVSLSNTFYDLVHARQVKTHVGDLDLKDQAVVFVVYADKGLQTSHIKCLEYFHENEYSPIVVSNLPLSDTDREKLKALSWQVIERPNIGYDFGAYREGILTLGDKLKQLNNLVLINDSAWFPLPGSRSWLEDVKELNVDFTAAASHYGVAKVQPEEFRQQEWSYGASHTNFHYTSFALSFAARIVADPKFRTFWRRYKLTNRKNRVVRRGEIGLSKWVLRNGYSHGETLDLPCLDQRLKELRRERLYEIANGVIISWPEFNDLFVRLTEKPESASKDELEKFILCAAATQGGSYTLAEYSIFERSYPFLKKSPISWDEASSDRTLSIIERLPKTGAEYVMKEALALRFDKTDFPAVKLEEPAK